MISDLQNFNLLTEIMEGLSREGQAEILAYALKVQEKEKIEKRVQFKGESITGRNLNNQADKNIQRLLNLTSICTDKLNPLQMAAVYLKCKEMTGQSISHEIDATYELVKRQIEIPMQEYFDKNIPGVKYEDALALMKKMG